MGPTSFAPGSRTRRNVYVRLAGANDLGVAEILPDDAMYTRGTQVYARTGGRLAPARG